MRTSAKDKPHGLKRAAEETTTLQSESRRSNLVGFWTGLGLIAVFAVVTALIDPSVQSRWSVLGLTGFALMPTCIAFAELRSGYAWKNMARGGRGVARIESPFWYWWSIIEHFVISAVIVVLLVIFAIYGEMPQKAAP